MEQPPNTGNEPKHEEDDSTHGKPISSTTANSELAEKKSDTTEQNSNDTNSKHNPSEVAVGWWKRKWEFVVVPQHSNAIVAIFSALLFIVTSLYCVFAALQWCEMKNAVALTRRQIFDSEVAQSAQLLIEDFSPTVTASENTRLVAGNIKVKNAGPTIAREILVEALFRVGNGSHDFGEYPEFVPTPIENGPSVAPSESKDVYKYGWGTDEHFFQANAFVVIEFLISYRDIFKNPRIVYGCYTWEVQHQAFVVCPTVFPGGAGRVEKHK